VDGAPRSKGTTPAGEGLVEPLRAGCTITWLAVMVVPLVVPSTRTLSPVLRALAEVGLVPLRYFVEDAFSTITFCPVEVDIVKLDLDTLATVPDDPPAAGPDRALDPPPPGTRCAEAAEVDGAVVAVPEPVLAVAPTRP
jgi:hypothetical protein